MGSHAVYCMVLRSWRAAVKQCAFFLFWDCIRGLLLCCLIMCTLFLHHGMFNVLARPALTIFLHLCFLVRVPSPSHIKFEPEDFIPPLLYSRRSSSHSSCKQNHPPLHSMFALFKYSILCIVTTPSPCAFNIYTSLKLSQSNFPLCFILERVRTFGPSGSKQ